MRLPKINIGTFNLLNLSLPNVEYYPRRSYTQETYEKKLVWLGNQLSKMKGDILGFQEVFHDEALLALLKSNIATAKYNVVSTYDSANTKRPYVALATRFEILEEEVFTDFPSLVQFDDEEIAIKRFSRPVLRCKVKLSENMIIQCFVAHLKSKRPDYPDDIPWEEKHHPKEIAHAKVRSLVRRTFEAAALRELLLPYLMGKDEPVILMGDLNDNNLAVSTKLISGEPPKKKEKSKVKRKIWDSLLYNVKDIQARMSFHDYYFSHIHNGHYEALDHILVSQEFVAENPKSIGRVVYVKVLNDHILDETLSDEAIPDWQSDHGQVVASIELKHQLFE
ncbi:MAG: endonuclease/exonuclease/phosphatase family protein [Bacteroidota bacterium]